jgi:peptidoglycan lytic transglycosylase B
MKGSGFLGMRRRAQLALLGALLGALLTAADAGTATAEPGAVVRARAAGWGYLVEKLVADGQDRERVSLVFADERFPSFDGLRFSLQPREPRSLYRGFLTSASVGRARLCHAQHADAFAAAEERHGVPASVVAAILHIETACGRNTGSSRILPALARLAMAAAPDNLATNIEAHTGARLPASAAAAQPTVERARYLESTFYPEVLAAFEISDRLDIDPLEVRGSGSGAFGIPQFLPTSYVRFGRDGNGDGRVSLYDVDDAIASCAAYLEGKGWQRGMTLREKREVIWHYNRSPAYVDTVLALASRIETPAPAAPRGSVRSARRATKPGTTAKSKLATAGKRKPAPN